MPQPYRGVRVQQTVRLPADLHRAAVGYAKGNRWTFNDLVCAALEEYVGEVPEPVGVRPNQNIYDNDGVVISR